MQYWLVPQVGESIIEELLPGLVVVMVALQLLGAQTPEGAAESVRRQ